MAQPRKGSPFQGISGTNAPARNTRIPNLTAQVTLAKTRKAALTHGGLLTPEQQKAASEAGKALAAHKQVKRAAEAPKRAPQSRSKPLAPKPLSDSTPPRALPLPNSAPFRVPLPSAPPPTPPQTNSSPGRRGALGLIKGSAPHTHHGSLLGAIGNYLEGPALGHTAANAIGHSADLAAGTAIAALGPSLKSDVEHPIARIQEARKRGLVTTNEASTALAARVGHLGVGGAIPKGFSIPSIDLVAPAGAATTKGAITVDELKALEAQGYDLKPRLRKRFTQNALKNGWNPAELDGLSGSALIDKAFTHPAALPLRVLANTASGIARLGTLPAGIEGAIRETAAGHGLKVGQALGEGLYSELPIVGKHKTTDTAVADPFGFITQFAGAGKTVGTVAALGRAGNVARVVESAASGLKVPRGSLSRNAYTAAGQLASDKLASTVPHFGGKLEAKQVDTLVRSAVNKHAPEYVAVQRPYKAALDKVGQKRGAELQAYQQAGGKPEQIAAFYRAQGESGPAKFYDRVAKTTKTLTPEDHTFLETHAALTRKTSEALQQSGKFSDTASEFRRYSPLIRSSAHLGDPEAQRILALRDEYLKGFDVMPPEDVQALRGAIDQGVQDYAQKHLATPDSLIAKAQTEHAAERSRIESSAPATPKAPPVARSISALSTKLEKKYPGLKLAVSEKGDHITLSRIELPKEARGQGTGSEIMAQLHAYADAKGKTMALTPSGDFGGTVTRLKKFYRGHGYVPNTGRNKDFGTTESMLRLPGEAPTPAAAPRVDLSQAHSANDARLAARIEQARSARPGIEPSYVAYGKPKPLIASPFTPSAGGTIGFKTPKGRQKAETGATFESGKFLIDPTSPLAENVRAQRQHLASVLHEDVSKAVGTHLTAGDSIPAGHVFVSETNLRGLRRTTNDLADNPVSSPDYYAEEAGVRQKLYDHLHANTQPSGQRVPRGEKGYAIPEAAWKRILDHTRPPSRGAYMKFMRQYQRVLVSYRPSTIVNNTVGSLPLAMTGGAGPKSFAMAARAMRDPTLAPAVLRSHGVAGSFAPSARSTVGTGLDFMRSQSAKGEDFSRLATFFSKAGPTIKRRAKELNQTTDEYARAFAAGKVDEPLLNAALDHTEKFIGDMLKPDGPLARKAGGVILFHSWVGHIAKLLLKTLPVDHPRRLNLLLTLSAYGDQYRQEHGVWPDWYREYLPLFQHVERIGRTGRPQTFTKTFSTAGVNPFSTINNLANPVSTNESAKNILAGLAAPPIQIAFNALANRPADSKSVPRYVAGQVLRQVPGVSVVRPQGGMASDSIPFFSEKRKKYTGKTRGSTLPYDFRPGARAEPGILGALIRYGLGGVYDVPAQGPIHNIEQGKHIGAAARAARKH